MLAWLLRERSSNSNSGESKRTLARVKAGEQRKATWQKRLRNPLAPVLLVLAN